MSRESRMRIRVQESSALDTSACIVGGSLQGHREQLHRWALRGRVVVAGIGAKGVTELGVIQERAPVRNTESGSEGFERLSVECTLQADAVAAVVCP